jgi:transcriptional regulator
MGKHDLEVVMSVKETVTDNEQMELLRGTLDMLILKALIWGPMHGYDVMGWLHSSSEKQLAIEEGALYPALHRMEERGWIKADWGLSDNNRRAKFYQLTTKGREQLTAQTSSWARYVTVVEKILQTA